MRSTTPRRGSNTIPCLASDRVTTSIVDAAPNRYVRLRLRGVGLIDVGERYRLTRHDFRVIATNPPTWVRSCSFAALRIRLDIR